MVCSTFVNGFLLSTILPNAWHLANHSQKQLRFSLQRVVCKAVQLMIPVSCNTSNSCSTCCFLLQSLYSLQLSRRPQPLHALLFPFKHCSTPFLLLSGKILSHEHYSLSVPVQQFLHQSLPAILWIWYHSNQLITMIPLRVSPTLKWEYSYLHLSNMNLKAKQLNSNDSLLPLMQATTAHFIVV